MRVQRLQVVRRIKRRYIDVLDKRFAHSCPVSYWPLTVPMVVRQDDPQQLGREFWYT